LIDRNIECVRSGLEPLKGGSDILCSLDHEWSDFETKHAGAPKIGHLKRHTKVL
jgi:hypothetical protein